MTSQTILALVVLSALPACTNPATGSPPRASSNGRSAPVSTPAEAPSTATPSCGSSQFVACETGDACSRRKGVLVNPPKACFDHAQEACTSLACAHGCDIYHGSPLEVRCATNASSTGHMKRCGGFANWACPEQMECDLGPNAEKTLDPSGTCVPERSEH